MPAAPPNLAAFLDACSLEQWPRGGRERWLVVQNKNRQPFVICPGQAEGTALQMVQNSQAWKSHFCLTWEMCYFVFPSSKGSTLPFLFAQASFRVFPSPAPYLCDWLLDVKILGAQVKLRRGRQSERVWVTFPPPSKPPSQLISSKENERVCLHRCVCSPDQGPGSEPGLEAGVRAQGGLLRGIHSHVPLRGFFLPSPPIWCFQGPWDSGCILLA